MADGQVVHASCVIIDEAGFLIRGPSGAGKSTLARELVLLAQQGGRFARLISDDRTRLELHHGRVIARPVEAIAGQIEVRGLGILQIAHESAAVVRLVIDLWSNEPPRLPLPQDATVTLCGAVIPRIRNRFAAGSAGLVFARASSVRDTHMT